MNFEISNPQIKNVEDKTNKSNILKTADIDTSQSIEKEEKITEKELDNLKNLNKEDSSYKKEINNDDSYTLKSSEKNIITVDLTNDEKIVFSQLGINPLIKLGKEYLTSNNFVNLKDSNTEKEKTLNNKKTTKKTKKIKESKEAEVMKVNIEIDANYQDKSTKNSYENEEVEFLEKEVETEFTDEINNARKKRRRSSANIE